MSWSIHSALADNSGLRSLWQVLGDQRRRYLLAVLALALATAARTAMFLLLRQFVDTVLVTGGSSAGASGSAAVTAPATAGAPLLATAADLLATVWSTPWLVAAGFLVLALAQGSLTFLSDAQAAQSSEQTTRRVRDTVYAHLLRLPFTYHDQTPTGELIQRATSDIDSVRRTLSKHAIGVGRIVFMFSLNVAAMLALEPWLVVASLPLTPFTIIVTIFFFRRMSAAYESMQAQDARLTTVLQENVTGMRVVKAFARGADEIQRFGAENQARFERSRELVRLDAWFWPVTDAMALLQTLAGFVVGAVLAIRGDITIGTYVAFTGLVVWILWPIRELGRLVVEMSKGIVSTRRLAEILRRPPEPLDQGATVAEAELQGGVRFAGVSFAYAPRGDDPPRAVLHDIELSCPPGSVVALLGHTGAGKTTLMRLLARFYDYEQGNIYLGATELRNITRRQLRQRIGIVDQEPLLFSRSIRDNITYGVRRAVSDEEVYAAASDAAVHEVILSFPAGYRTMVGERGVTLSGGQRQRITIARTLLEDPAILVLDDATSAVDAETEGRIWSALRRRMTGRVTFVIAHRVQSLMRADQIVVLDRGRIVQTGTHAELIAGGGLYRELYDLQVTGAPALTGDSS